MSLPSLRVVIVIVSTTASKDPSTDATGKLLRSLFASDSGTGSATWDVVGTEIVSDDRDEIHSTFSALLNGAKPELIVTTGGTGFAVSDITPEVRSPSFYKILC